MARCPHCEYPIPDDRERVGARCSSCHDPLYEPAERFSRQAREGEASCERHAHMESLGLCSRCGHHLCETCRTRWRGTIICATCAELALASREASSEQARTHSLQANAAILLSGAAWLAAGLALGVLAVLSGSSSDLAVMATFLSLLVIASAGLLAAVGVGQAVGALRTGGTRSAVAGIGLGLGGLYIGLLLGVGLFSLRGF
jgi:hypothetical protein